VSFVWAILRREVRSYLVSPLTYTAIAVFIVFQGVAFFFALGEYERMRLSAAQNPMMTVPGTESLVRGFLGHDIIWTMLVIVPLVTMRLLSEERRQRTADLLLTAPLTTRQLVIGKYVGALCLLVAMLVLTAWMPLLLGFWGDIDHAPLLTGYLGAFLYGALLIAIGLLASSLTESVMIAAFLTLLMIAGVNVAGVLATEVPIIGYSLEKFTPSGNLQLLAQGVIDTLPLVFFASTIAFVVELTARIVDSQRWR
jgi:ABC-2 type transport system permease protein